jgi:SAM-dependent methyltransferase
MQSRVVGRPCETCGSARVRLLRHSDRWGFDVGRCASCKMVFVLTPSTGDAQGVHNFDDIDMDGYVSVMRENDPTRVASLQRIQSLLRVSGRKPMLFDVGAGAGTFLLLAREYGFDISGNELSSNAVVYAKEHHDIELSPLPLDAQPPQSVDAITMGCVLAHVPEQDEFLRGAYEMLRPGGVLFMRTPRWCLIDSVGVGMARISRNRFDQIADRRVFPGHWHHYSRENMVLKLRKIGFVDNEATPTCHYAMSTEAYLKGTGGPIARLSKASPVLEKLVARDWLPRNTLMVYARRPYDS